MKSIKTDNTLSDLHTLAFGCNFPKSLETVLKLYINRTLYLDVSFNATYDYVIYLR